MVEKAEDSDISLLLDIILQETRKHRELLKHLSSVFEDGGIISSQGCEEMGEWFKKAVALTRTVREEVQLGLPIPEAARKLVVFEKNVGEEYLTLGHVRLRALVQENPAVKTVLESIAADEEGHADILQLIMKTGR
jgi:rubrerythrin